MYLDYKSIRETLESFSQSPASGEDKLNSSKWKELDSKNWDEEANMFDENIQKMDKYLEQFLKMKVYYQINCSTYLLNSPTLKITFSLFTDSL